MASRSERLGRAALEHYSTVPLFNTKAVVRQTGVPAPTLRAWERRYGILSPHRGENDYRLYSERDIAIVRWLREEVESGLTISQAIALLRTLIPSYAAVQGQSALQETDDTIQPEQSKLLPPNAPDALASQHPPAPGNGHLLASLEHELFTAFTRLNEPAAQHLLGQAFARFPLEQVITRLIEPVLRHIGERWEAGHLSITIEHFSTAILRAQLETLYRAERVPASGPVVLVGCAPGEYHELGSLVLALFLRRHYPNLRVLYLGQNINPLDLVEVVQTLRPAVVCLSAALAERQASLVDLARRLLTLPAMQRPMLVCGGQGLDPEALPKEPSTLYLKQNALDAIPSIAQICLNGQQGAGPTTRH
ncbi:MAG TPA: MerR family transcriptional regulator [Ktedonobacterales bacterium]|jgi:DNA-binding transcriptional MerR regulator